jgi:hypothetical protein
LKSLAQGKRELTYPRAIAAGYIARALAPGFTRKQLRRVTLDAVRKHLANTPPAPPGEASGDAE